MTKIESILNSSKSETVDYHGESKWIDTEKFNPDGVAFVAMAVLCSAKALYTLFIS